MSENWSAVAKAINERLAELGLSQRELIERSRVSKAVVREIQHNAAERRRSARTLEALSRALEWHPGHLAAVANGHRPPAVGEPVVRSNEDVPGRLDVIEHQLRDISERLEDISAISDRLSEINSNVETVIESLAPGDKRRPN